jgi:hypothetical protein
VKNEAKPRRLRTRHEREIIDSVRQWRFRPYTTKGVKRKFCGRVVLRFEANEHAVKYEVI